MGLLITYFSAGSDEAAAATIDWPTGPEGGPVKRLLKRKEPGHLSIDGHGIEPVVQLGMFEQLLTGKSFDSQLDDPASRPMVAIRDGGERLVVRIGDDFVDALAAVDRDQLPALADKWAEIEEFHGMADPRALEDRAAALGDLARTSRRHGANVYCWVSV
jgi:hypothetical protein